MTGVSGGLPNTPNYAQELAWELRMLKQKTGLSFSQLGSKTNFSKSSMERYLNGKLLPPRQAVEAISALCGGDRSHLLKLWDQAIAQQTVPKSDQWRVPIQIIVVVVVVSAALAVAIPTTVVLTRAREQPQAASPTPRPLLCDYPQVCLYGPGPSRSAVAFNQYTNGWRELPEPGAVLVINRRHDDAVKIRWKDRYEECIPPDSTYTLAATPQVIGVSILHDAQCPAGSTNTRATPLAEVSPSPIATG